MAAGVIHNTRGQILIAKRADDAHQGGLWEFPGGKLEAGEAAESALIRELQEELGITATHLSPLIQIRHDYPDKSVLLDVWTVTAFTGEAHGREGQPVKWVSPSTLSDYQFPAANTPIVTAAQLPRRLLITDAEVSVELCLQKVTEALHLGIQLVQLRQKDWRVEQWAAAVPRMAKLCREAGARLMLNSPPDLALETLESGLASLADGLHLTSRQLGAAAASGRVTDKHVGWLSAACHTDGELRLAEQVGVDFVTLSPVLATGTHPEQAPMGWEQFEALVKNTKIPVYALGGMNDGDLPESVSRGGQGIAAISAWWPSQN
ncbi:Nudix family hydrolase [Pseudomaricurvus hydrocarbonicus]